MIRTLLRAGLLSALALALAMPAAAQYSDLPLVTTPADVDELYLVDEGTTLSRITYESLVEGLLTSVDLTADVTGVLPVANGGTGAATAAAARTALGVDPAGTDNSTDVTLTGTPDYITITDQVITRGLVDLATDVTGALPIANGGTGAANAAAARAALGVDPAGTDNSTDVTLTGTPDYITITDQVITRGLVDLAADVTGALPVANGGTGQTALAAVDAADLGSGTAHDGLVLTADGNGAAAFEALPAELPASTAITDGGATTTLAVTGDALAVTAGGAVSVTSGAGVTITAAADGTVTIAISGTGNIVIDGLEAITTDPAIAGALYNDATCDSGGGCVKVSSGGGG